MQNTNPYYRSGYVIVHRPELQLTEGRLDDPVFKALRVGMQPRTPVATLVARYGLLDRARSYPLIVDTRLEKPARDMVQDVAEDEIDAALVWGPLAGYWVKERSEEHTSELQSLMRISYAVFCLKKKKKTTQHSHT